MCKYCTLDFKERDRYILPVEKKNKIISSTGINIDSISLDGDGYTVITLTSNKITKENGELARLAFAYIVPFKYCPFCGRKLEDTENA